MTLLIDKRLDWHNNASENTYRRGFDLHVPIPEHPHMGELYDEVYIFAYKSWFEKRDLTWEEFLDKLAEKYGEINQDVADYLKHCPYEAGSRAGMLEDDPFHYE